MKQELKTQKNKAGTLMCFLLAVSLGTLTGCSGTKNDTAVTSAASEEIATDGVGREIFDSENVETSADNETEAVIDKEQAAEDERILTIMKGGEPEEKQAKLVSGEGFLIYLPKEEWQEDGANQWRAAVNQDVRIWVEVYENAQAGQAALSEYASEEGQMVKQEGELVYKAQMHETENGVWCVSYCYPLEAEEGWGRELPVIADTFAVTAP